ncbi:MAG: hypothetical protein CMB22_01070 [Euryarchaeota archaeon]|jgi:glycerophosphoryl diester phosphodiesterase|nr:hypothetical protein [Euryarchaeota archaeon]|tara:strand:+ start:3260 stop:3835 length:576 start_codon:yes stop_codon:yes gene_type:complete
MKNPGHRLGASGTILENTLEGLRGSIQVASEPNFRYWEFDIRESSDGVLFVFHDDEIDVNGTMFETRKMRFSDIEEAGRESGIRIPTFREVATELEGREEPVVVEIKQIASDKARTEVINTLSAKRRWKVMATPERFEEIFPPESRDKWRAEFDEAKVNVVRVGRHRVDLFVASRTKLGWIFAGPRWFFGL